MISNQTLILILIVLVAFSAMFSSVETAFSSASRIRLKNLANDDKPGAEAALKILENFDHLLTTVLIGNNIVNIMMATISAVLFTRLYGGHGPTISTIVTTLIVLSFGEIVPKSIAKQTPEKIVMYMAGFAIFFQYLFFPLSWIFSLLQKTVVKMFHVDGLDSDIADELITMVDEAEKDGNLDEHESNLITSAIEFNDLNVEDVLTPRVDVVAIDITMTMDQIEKAFRVNAFSRLPVYENSIDNIVGVVHEKDFYNLYYQEKGLLRKIIKPIIYTSENTKISTLLKQLQGAKLHMAVVLDEYGGTTGIITLEDIIEELVGEIWDEHDTVKEYFQKINDSVYLVRCDADVDDMFEYFDIEPDDDEYDYITVSGWVIHALEHIPLVGDTFEFQNLYVTITKADRRKVLEIKVEVLREKEEDVKGER